MPVMAEPTASAVFLSTLSSSVYLDALSTRETSAPPVPLPLIRVGLPVADPFLRLHDVRALGDVHPARDAAAARVGPALPVRLPAAAAEMPPETAAGLPVGVDALVDPLTPRHRLALLAEAPADLLGAPALGQPLLRHAPQLRRHLARHRRGRAAAPVRLALGLLVAVAAPAGVAPHLAPDRRAVAAELAGDRRAGKPAFPQGVDLAAFRMRPVAMALGHDGLLLATKELSPPPGRFATSCVAERPGTLHQVLHFRVERGTPKRQSQKNWATPRAASAARRTQGGIGPTEGGGPRKVPVQPRFPLRA